MAAIWNPQTVLDAFPESHSFTCIGTTKKGARCRQFMFSSADLSEASKILNTISLLRPNSRSVFNVLSDLAHLMLCPRWHREPGYSQVTKIVQKWQAMIENHCASITRTITTTTSRPSSSITRSSSDHARATSTSLPSPHTLTEDSPRSLAPRRSTISPSRRTGLSTPQTLPGRSPVPSVLTAPNILTSNPSLDLATPPTTPTRQNNTSAVPSPGANTDSSRLRRHNSATSAEPPESSTTAPSVPVPSPCPRPKHSARRKPITENCGICYEPICCSEDAVWCRAQCGQNIHRACFGEWRKHCLRGAVDRRVATGDDDNGDGLELESMLKVVKCAFCRASWRFEWED
jgi:hypothetical protein